MKLRTNYEKFVNWAWNAVIIGGIGACVGGIVLGISAKSAETFEAFVGGAILGSALGAIPAAISAWFLALHMIGQIAKAVRDKD